MNAGVLRTCRAVGAAVGATVGSAVGVAVGAVGVAEGAAVGAAVGSVGAAVGAGVGAAVMGTQVKITGFANMFRVSGVIHTPLVIFQLSHGLLVQLQESSSTPQAYFCNCTTSPERRHENRQLKIEREYRMGILPYGHIAV
jgi:hypothetical protein